MRWRFSYEEWKERKYRWHRWFAWYPMKIDWVNDIWCWMTVVERRYVAETKSSEAYWEYRERELPVTLIKNTVRDGEWGRAISAQNWAPPRTPAKVEILPPYKSLFEVFDPPDER